MAKKSRRQKLPSEKDFEKLNGTGAKKDDSTKTPSKDPESSKGPGDTADLSEAAEAIRSQPTYKVDGGISVSLAGDVTGAKAAEEPDAKPDDIILDEESFEELFGESPQDFLRQVNAKPLGDELAEPVFKPLVESTEERREEPAAQLVDDLADDPLAGRGVDEPDEDTASAGDDGAEEDDAPRPPEVLILVGSPHKDGKSALFGRKLSEYLRLSGAAVTFFEIAKYPVAACTGCNVCCETGTCCIKGDAWNVLARHMESCAALVVIAPVYFAGPSGWLKAALDRCQMYWARKYVLKQWVPRKRPAHLVVIGDGGDPFGTEPLEVICTSALNCANLRVEPSRITRMIGDQFDLSRAITLTGQIMASIGRA